MPVSVQRDAILYLARKGKVTVSFIKKDGSERTMVATLDPFLLPEFEVKETDQNAPIKTIDLNNATVWDVESSGWRKIPISEETVILSYERTT